MDSSTKQLIETINTDVSPEKYEVCFALFHTHTTKAFH